MTLAHIGAWKVAMTASGIVAATSVALDPSVKVAIIAIIPLTITSIGGLLMQFLARRDAKKLHEAVNEVKVNTDGLLTKLQGQKDAASARADRAEGHIEGAQTERDKTP